MNEFRGSDPGTSSDDPTLPGQSFFDSIRRSGLFRTEERWIGGVAGGIAYRLGIDPLIVRGGLVVLTFFGGLGLLLYGLGWAFLPEQVDGRIHAQEALRGHVDPGLAGAAVMVIIGLARHGLWWHGWWWGEPWPLFGLFAGVSITVLVLWLVFRDRDQPAAPGPGAGEGAPATVDGEATTPTQAAPGHHAAATETPPSAPHADTAQPAEATTHADTAQPAEATTGGPPVGAAHTARTRTARAQTGGQSAGSHHGAGPAAGPDRDRPAPPPPPYAPYAPGPGRVLTLVTSGLALLSLAAVLLAGRALGVWTGGAPWLLAAGAVLVVVGAGILVAGARGRRGGGLTGLSVLAMLLVVPVTLTLGIAPQVRDALSLSPSNMGDVYWAPASQADLAHGYTHTAGDLEVDLGTLPPTTDFDQVVEAVPITLAAGRIVIHVPSDLNVDLRVQGTGAVRVDSPATWFSGGSVVRTETNRALLRQEVTMRSTRDARDADLSLDVAVGAGQVRLVDAPPIGIPRPISDSTTQEN